MPQIPTVIDLGGRPAIRSNRPIGQDRSGEILAAGIAQFGDSLQRTGAQMLERENRTAYAKAKTDLLIAATKVSRTVQDDPDYDNWEKSYRTQMQRAIESVSGRIHSNSDRALFEEDAALLVERGAASIGQASFGRKSDQARADVANGLEGLRVAGLEESDPGIRSNIISTANDLINSAKADGYIGAEEAEKYRQRWTADYAEGSIAMMDPGDAVEALSAKEGPANFIDPVRRKALLEQKTKEFRIEQVRTESRQAADSIMDKYHDRGLALEAARKIGDDEVRKATVDDVNRRFNELRVIESERHDQALDTATDLVESTKSTRSIDPSVWNALTVGDKQSLERRVNQLTAGVEPETDWDLYYKLRTMAADDPEKFRELPLNTLRSSLHNTEFKELVKLQTTDNDTLTSGLRTSNQIVDGAIDAMGISTAYTHGEKRKKMAAKEIRFRRAVDERIKATGKPATPELVQGIVDDLMLETVFVDDFGFDSEVPAFAVSEDDAGDTYVPIDKVPADAKTEIANLITFGGGTATDEKIEKAYAAYLLNDKARMMEIISQ